jgi:hypothetical protein
VPLPNPRHFRSSRQAKPFGLPDIAPSRTLGSVQGRAGATMNRLPVAVSQAQTMSVSVAASESRIRDANIAEKTIPIERFGQKPDAASQETD